MQKGLVNHMRASKQRPVGAFLQTAFMFMLAAMLVACGATKQLQNGHLHYNETVRRSSDEEILLNIVRLRYLEPMEFLSVTAINSTISFSAELDLTAGEAASNNTFTGEITATYSNSPTFSFVPQRGDDFSTRFINPVDLEDLIAMTSAHRDTHTVFRLFVTWMNGLDNQEGLVDPGFITVTREITNLQYQGTALFGFREMERAVAPPIPAAELTPALVIEAHKAGLDIREQDDGKMLQFAVADPQAMLNIDQDSPERSSILSNLQLDPDLSEIPIVSEAEFIGPIDRQHLAIRTRSLLHTLSFLSQGIEVPQKDIDSGVAAWPWPHSSVKPVPMGDIFQVRYSDKKPDNASLAVKHRKGWFYISNTDDVTKRTFLLVAEAFRFTLESNSDKGPTLTFPVGGGGN